MDRAIPPGEIARRHGRVRVVDIPNGGLSAARNVGLAEATGEIVAYTDADTRVDPDWLTFLVQPFLTSEVVGSGGPNVIPPDDPPMAQCIARAPGGPTHVLLHDRLAEHVPAATWPSAAISCSRSAGSTRSICAPATMWMCAGGCRLVAGRLGLPPLPSCGITTARR
jgi:glycosyltransferase involved in cell wall biosynthesis